MRSLMISGATTPVGRMLVSECLRDPRIERVLAVGIEPSAPMFEDAGDRFAYHSTDLTRPRALRDLLFGPARDAGVEAIVHLAFHRRASDEGEPVHRLNVEALRALLDLAEHHPTIERFVLRSHADVYRIAPSDDAIIDEDHALDLSPSAAQRIRDRVEADLIACARMGLSRVKIAVLRAAECCAPGDGSQLLDYLESRVCFRPLGFDPMINLLAPEDLVAALALAVHSKAEGVFNIPGKDTLPLSQVISRVMRIGVPIPDFMLGMLYRWRSLARHTDFRFDVNRSRFHFGARLCGRRAQRVLDFVPARSVFPALRGEAVI